MEAYFCGNGSLILFSQKNITKIYNRIHMIFLDELKSIMKNMT